MLVRRLRRFGGRAVDEASALTASSLIETVAALLRSEAKSSRVLIEIAPVDPDLMVFGQEIELVQAIVNLVRNAIQASDDCVRIAAEGQGDRVVVTVTNRCREQQAPQPGMGVGSLVARAILEAHEGTLVRETDAAGTVRATLALPLVGAAE
ncbi:ATP-binding protein [Sphingomonas desiccabilis]|uniref:Uncharacterized protein n=1 Tax=Sphingomonas desiccabilis TaxID=429134 RepID=A0A4Q2IKU0_9SPHN|nr:ATP-binding protein [Sphingomonas desiccabilis]MBB3912565.1 signal transduction histidine kinase [Sphingomonas desiccabilis]RXZ29861.1 hypothetical protein EO081_16040 [Sphingomonas desiccabilis]